jgi:hypothetical protein
MDFLSLIPSSLALLLFLFKSFPSASLPPPSPTSSSSSSPESPLLSKPRIEEKGESRKIDWRFFFLRCRVGLSYFLVGAHFVRILDLVIFGKATMLGIYFHLSNMLVMLLILGRIKGQINKKDGESGSKYLLLGYFLLLMGSYLFTFFHDYVLSSNRTVLFCLKFYRIIELRSSI